MSYAEWDYQHGTRYLTDSECRAQFGCTVAAWMDVWRTLKGQAWVEWLKRARQGK